MHLPRPDLTISRDGTLLALAAERELAAVTPARTEAVCKGGVAEKLVRVCSS